MTPVERRIRQKLKNDFIFYAERCLKIKDKQGALLPFRLNAAQAHVHGQIEQQRRATGKVRALILKGRQQGCSTYVEGRFYWSVTHTPGAQAFILTHLEEASKGIYQIAKRFHDHCPALVRPHTGLANSRELVFDRLDAGYRIGTAKSPGVGRSNTLQFFHGSEVAYWSNAEEHIAGILQAVPDMSGTEVILESTSAGADGVFHAMCRDAQAKRSDYIFIFVPWFWQPEYQKEISDDARLTSEEIEYQALYNLTPKQIFWRRGKIAELGSLATFRREYPATPEEAFEAERPGALWLRETLRINRRQRPDMPDLVRIVIAVDPAATSAQASDETGIIAAGLGTDGHAYVLEDLSGRYTPDAWARIVIDAYHRHNADRIVAEVNQGGDMVEHTLRTVDPQAAYKAVRASRGKVTRAEPIAALDTQGKIHHVGALPALEDQMCRFVPGAMEKSPDRVDARVWALTELMLNKKPGGPRAWGS